MPEGFRLFNSPDAVIAKGPDDATIIFDRARKPSDGPVQYYLTNVWARGTSLREVETIRVNGMEAATATAQIRTKKGQRNARLLAVRQNLQTIYQFAFLTYPGATKRWTVPFRRTSYSFRLMSKSEADALKPLRLRTIRVRRGDTARSLARRMAGDDGFSLERFRVLNGLRGNRDVQPGQLVKIVTE